MPRTLYIGDLHMGNEYASILDFLMLLEEASKNTYDEIVFLGDFIDGINKYKTQSYKQFPESLTEQAELLKWLIEFVSANMKYDKLVFIVGNHEMDSRGSLIDFEVYSKAFNVEFKRHYIDINNMLCLHQLSKSARVGSQSGWTPSLVDKAKSIMMHYRDHGVKGIITAHVHKILDILYNSGYLFVLMPSFLTSGRRTAEDYMFKPALFELNDSGHKVYMRSFSEFKIIKLFNMRLANEVMIDRSRVMSFDDIKKILSDISDEITEDSREIIGRYTTSTGKNIIMLYDKDDEEYIIMEGNKRLFRVPARKFVEVVNMLAQKWNYSEIQRETGVPRRAVSIIDAILRGGRG